MKYIDAECLKAKLDEHYRKYQSKYMETRTPYTQGLIDALDLAEQVIDSLQQEQPSEDLEEAAEEQTRSFGYMKEDYEYKELIETFKAGAEWQKEQIAELSIHDLELLHTFLYAVKNNKHGAFTFTRLSDEQYEEVLRRFNKARKEESK